MIKFDIRKSEVTEVVEKFCLFLVNKMKKGNSEIDDGYQIERGVLVNNIGSLVTDKDILKDKDFLTDEELLELEYDEVNDLYVEPNSIESDMELE